MSGAVFDTYASVKRLTAAGMPEAQAEVLADEQRRLVDDRLVTKDDVGKPASNMATKTDIAEVKAEILKWMFGQTLLIIGVLTALLRFGH
jgi:hypothetical protein